MSSTARITVIREGSSRVTYTVTQMQTPQGKTSTETVIGKGRDLYRIQRRSLCLPDNAQERRERAAWAIPRKWWSGRVHRVEALEPHPAGRRSWYGVGAPSGTFPGGGAGAGGTSNFGPPGGMAADADPTTTLAHVVFGRIGRQRSPAIRTISIGIRAL